MPVKKDYLYFYKGTENDYLQYINNGDLNDKVVFFTTDTRTIYYDGVGYGINDTDPTSANRISSVNVLDDGSLEIHYSQHRKKLSAILHRKFSLTKVSDEDPDSLTDEKIANLFDRNEDAIFNIEGMQDSDDSLKSIIFADNDDYEVVLNGWNTDSGIVEGSSMNFKRFSYFTLVINDRVFQTVFRVAKNEVENQFKLVIHKIKELGGGQEDNELRDHVYNVVDVSVMSLEDQLRWKNSY